MLWRLSRALYHMAKSAKADEAKAMIYEAYDLVCKALALRDDVSQVHKWYTVLLDSKSEYEGTKARIQQLQKVKDHMLVKNLQFLQIIQKNKKIGADEKLENSKNSSKNLIIVFYPLRVIFNVAENFLMMNFDELLEIFQNLMKKMIKFCGNF